jgi:predicted P-loop ATPase
VLNIRPDEVPKIVRELTAERAQKKSNGGAGATLDDPDRDAPILPPEQPPPASEPQPKPDGGAAVLEPDHAAPEAPQPKPDDGQLAPDRDQLDPKPAGSGAAIERDRDEAERFLTVFAPNTDQFTFQTFDDNKERKKERAEANKLRKQQGKKPLKDPLARQRHGTLAEHWDELAELNNKGAGIYFTPNETDLQGRKIENIKRVRALFPDLDGAPLEPVLADGAPKTHIITETSPGRFQAYYLIGDDMPLDEFEPLQKAIAARFHGDPAVHDLPRVMRLPGFIHRKGEPFLVRVRQINEIAPYPWKVLQEAFAPQPPHADERPTQGNGPPSHDPGEEAQADPKLNGGKAAPAAERFEHASTFANLDPDEGYLGKDMPDDDDLREQWRNLNTEAIWRYPDWVPDIFPSATKTSAGGYRVSSADLGRDLEEDLSFHADGIKDFGVHDIGDPRQGKRTPIDVVKEHLHKDFKEAVRWLTEKLGLDPNNYLPKPKPKDDEAQGSGDPQVDVEIARLAKLSVVEYERERKDVAKKLGIRVGTLNDLVAKKKLGKEKERKPSGPEFRDCDKFGNPMPSLANAVIAIHALGIKVRYDMFHNRIHVTYKGESKTIHEGLLTDNTISAIRSLINNTYLVDCGDPNTLAAIREIAWDNSYDPVLDMLNACQSKWDGTKRIDTWVVIYLGCNDTPLNRAIGRIVLIAACRRARQPGCKFDNITVLEDKLEGTNKSTAIRILAGDENFSDQSILGANDKEIQEQLDGIWMHENADLAGMLRAEVERVKAFASRQVDRARPAFGRVREDRPRRSIEWGTTNNDKYLLSQTGNRRFWPLKTSKIDLEALRRDREQLLGEAATYEAAGETITLNEELWQDARDAQELRRVTDPWEDILANIPDSVDIFADGMKQKVTIVHRSGDGHERIASVDLLTYVLDIPKAQQNPAHGQRLANAMERLGWNRNPTGKVRINDVSVRGYIRPAKDVSEDDPPF